MLLKCYEKTVLEDLIVSIQEKRRVLKDENILNNIFSVALGHLDKALLEIAIYELWLNRSEFKPDEFQRKLVDKLCERN